MEPKFFRKGYEDLDLEPLYRLHSLDHLHLN